MRQVRSKQQQGSVLIVSLIVLIALTLVGVTAMQTTRMDERMAGNYRSSATAFLVAESGHEEARRRLNDLANEPAYPRENTPNDDPNWRAFIGTAEDATEHFGYDPNDSDHFLYPSADQATFTGGLDRPKYTMMLRPKLCGTDVDCNDMNQDCETQGNTAGQIVRWGDPNDTFRFHENTCHGDPILVSEAHGQYGELANRDIHVQLRRSNITVPGGFNSRAAVQVHGTSTDLSGLDSCGEEHLPGLISNSNVEISGQPTIEGDPDYDDYSDEELAYVANEDKQYDVESLAESLRQEAHLIAEGDTEIDDPNEFDFGEPEVDEDGNPSCDEFHIIHYTPDPDEPDGGEVTLNGMTGCGILLVDGSVNFRGGMDWYGAVVSTGTASFAGGGSNATNIYGSVVAGGDLAVDDCGEDSEGGECEDEETGIGGSMNLQWCSSAIQDLNNARGITRHRWRQLGGGL